MEETGHLVKNEAQKLTRTATGAARDIEKAGRLKATAAVIVVIHRMRTLAEAAKQAGQKKCKPVMLYNACR